MKRVAIGADLFPLVFQDVASGVYFSELKVPTDGVLDSVEVIVDSNILRELREHPNLFKRLSWILGPGVTINFNVGQFAFEQFMSNRESSLQKVKELTEHPALFNTFEPGFAVKLIESIKDGEQDMRQLIGTLAIYLFAIRSLFEQKMPLEEKLRRWGELFYSDVPKLTSLYFMGLIFFFGQANSRLEFTGSKIKVMDWAQHFLTSRRDEKADPCRWARNRLFDFMLFSNAPVLNIVAGGGKPGRLITATRDEYSGKCLYRMFGFYGEQRPNALWSVITNLDCLRLIEDPVFEKIPIESRKMYELSKNSRAPSIEEKKTRVHNLITSASAFLSNDNRQNLMRVLDELCVWTWIRSEQEKE
ncbi:hypothetical protein SB461_22105 [Burkholderia cenocepacia]|uniref:hypothetical protein n=1 Tax=Burkholderia cenocepacia TaxID=95486 RepID=UPI002B241F94|nr:hypothetical protein [Burkholderia cenocepacia]MEB2609193.1 hypothetical protein [Burkholderia cenocepacia]